MPVRIIKIIETNLEKRGCTKKEQDEGDVCRIITQYWDMDGNLLWEYDPCSKKCPLKFFNHPK